MEPCGTLSVSALPRVERQWNSGGTPESEAVEPLTWGNAEKWNLWNLRGTRRAFLAFSQVAGLMGGAPSVVERGVPPVIVVPVFPSPADSRGGSTLFRLP